MCQCEAHGVAQKRFCSTIFIIRMDTWAFFGHKGSPKWMGPASPCSEALSGEY